LIACLVILLLARMGEPLVAQEAGPTMRVVAGFDGYCRSGGWCPVRVILSNEGADVEGELRIAVQGAAWQEPSVYATRVVLPAHSRKAYFLYIPSAGSSYHSRLIVRLLAGDKVLSSEEVTVMRLDEERNRLYGVASSGSSALNFLSDVAPAGSRAVVAHLSLETLPSNPLGWEGLDVLILNDVDTTALSGERRQALETWVAHGGHLVVGGGAGAARTVAGVADLLPVTVGGTRPVDDLWALGEWLSVTVAAGPYAVAEAGLRDGEVLIEQGDEQGDLILLARRTHGAGKVDFLAFDPDLNPFTRWDDNVQLWEGIVGPGTAGARGLTVHNGYQARDAINAIPGLELPSTLQLLAFMLVYTLLIGPVNYVILRKLDRRELAWLTIPALIVGFTACAYVTGFQIRGTAAIVHRLAAVYVPEGARVGRVSEVVGLFSPRRTDYDVWVAGAGVREIPGDYYGGPARQPLHVVEEAEGSTVTGLRVDVGGIQPFVAEGYVDVSAVEADLQLVVSGSGHLRMEGTLRNGDVPLKEAVLIVGDAEQRLGDLEAGEEASVHLLYNCSGYGRAGNPEQILGTGDYWGNQELYRRYQFLRALSPYDAPPYYGPGGYGGPGLGLGRGVYLVGWVEKEVPLPVEVVDRPFSTFETTLYLYDLPPPALDMGAVITIPPALIARQVEEATGHVDIRDDYILIGHEASAVFRFTVWPEVTISQVDRLLLNLLQNTGMGGNSLPQHLELWDWEAGRWESQEAGWGSNVIPNPGRYVRPDGTVRVRLETDVARPAELKAVTITIERQR